MRYLLRNGLFGIVWLAILFGIDTWESLRHIERATRHIRSSAAVSTMLQDAAVGYVTGIALSYLWMGVVAGILLHLVFRILFPTPPGGLRWLGWAVAITGLTTMLGGARQVITFPPLHDWLPSRTLWADGVDPWMVTVADLSVAAAALVWAARRWHRVEGHLGSFSRRTAQLALALVALAVGLRNPSPDEPRANDGPNIVLLGVDCLRPDHLASHGYHRDTAPNIDSVLAESVSFEAAYTQLPRT
ncbi:MAG: hypothetical protein QGG40_03575, partial [Myxococcota bacterium]|nr:hypothetical protein [Myxococcota bacterium]